MPTLAHTYKVRAVHCDHSADDEAVYQALRRATAPLDAAWARLGRAKTIAIKFNQDKASQSVVLFKGQRQQLVSDSVVRATLRLLREHTDARLYCADVSFYTMYNGQTLANTTNIAHILREFEVEYLDGTQPPYVGVQTPGGGQMFRSYTLMEGVAAADEMVSVATIKNHAFMGVTGCLKNLFGLMPVGRLLDPALNVVDALVGQAGLEWSDGVGLGRVVDGLVAGDHVIATDACLMHLMGHDPHADWGTSPFHRDRNALLVAAEGGFGTVDLDAIDFETELAPQPEGTFYAVMTDSPATIQAWRRTMCEQALLYHGNRQAFERYAGEYILLQDGEVRWHSPEGTIRESRRALAGDHADHAMWYKFVDIDETEAEGEHYEVYERALAHLAESASPPIA